jgi:hypothetical protein
MEFSLDDNRAGAGSSILLSPEVIAIRAKLIEACDGKTFSEIIDFLKELLDKEQDEQKRLGILAARVYVLRQRIIEIQEKEDASLVSKFMAPEQDLPDNLREDNLFEDDEENDTGWVRLRITENSIVKGVRFPKGVIVDVHHEEAEILIEAGKAEIAEVSELEIDEELEDGSDTSSEQMEDEELEDGSDTSSEQKEDEE